MDTCPQAANHCALFGQFLLVFQIFQFLASIGGALGLWIGLSMLSFCEIMQLAGEVVHYFIHRCRHEDRVFRKKIAVELS